MRHALRRLWKTPGFTVPAALTVALGIGAATAIFSVVYGVLLRPLPYSDPARLVVVLERSLRHGGNVPVAPANFFDWRAGSRAFESMAAAELWGANLTGGDRTEQVVGLRVSPELFHVLGVLPALGRTLAAGDERCVVLSDGLWRRRFGADPGVVGRTITCNGAGHVVLGVMPPSFYFAPFWATKAEMWTPLVFTPERERARGGNSLRVFARLAPGVTIEQAQNDMDRVAAGIAESFPRTNTDRGARVTPLDEMVTGNIRRPILAIAAAVALLLLIACSNVALLTLTRADGRRKELALRTALGASSVRLAGDLLIESLILAILGGAGGVLLARWGVALVVTWTSSAAARFALPRQNEIGVDAAVLAFAIALCAAAALFFGLAPAFGASRANPSECLKEGARGSAQAGLRSAFVVCQLALSVMLLAGAGLLLRSLYNLRQIDPGFDPRNVVAMNVSLAGSKYAEPTRRAFFYRELQDRIGALPGVSSASAVNHVPLHGDIWSTSFTVEGQPPPGPGSVPSATFRVIQPGYLRTMRMTLLQGRDVEERDREDTPGVVLVNETLARRFWPDGQALGKRIRDGGPDSREPWLTVVGVVRNVMQWQWEESPPSEIYVPFAQAPPYLHNPGQHYTMTVVARTAMDAARVVPSLQEEVARIDRSLPIASIARMETVVAGSLWQPRFSTLLLGIFAAAALLLSLVGTYGVVSNAVSRRTHEIAVRMAVGASARGIARMVLGEAVRLAALGASLGIAGAFGLTRLISGMLYRVNAADPLTFAAAASVLVGAALAASYIPARRAARTDPADALRSVT
jgi:predicted permease